MVTRSINCNYRTYMYSYVTRGPFFVGRRRAQNPESGQQSHGHHSTCFRGPGGGFKI